MIKDILNIGLSILDKVIPDETERAKAKAALLEQQQKGELQNIEASMKVILAEAQGDGWLQKNWRPVTMLTFVALVCAKWLGFTVDGVTEAIEMELMKLIQIGLGGYVVGRSVEKGIKEWKK
jgi:hypothetical protein